MKLLQVANVLSVTGGPCNCVMNIAQSLPDWEHAAIFTNSGVSAVRESDKKVFEACGIKRLEKLTHLLPANVNEIEPDVILYHNTGAERMPNYLKDGIITMYYQHSMVGSAARRRCHYFFSVSKYLANRANIDDDSVLYQPCARPPKVKDRSDNEHVRIGRICTPSRAAKWPDVGQLYRGLSADYPNVWWDFVGCPFNMRDDLEVACKGRATFYDANYNARSLMWEWDALLYASDLQETYGRTVCEGQRVGCIPIVSQLGGFVEQIQHGHDGYLCSTPDEFGDAVRFVTDPDIRKEVSANAVKSGDLRGSLAGFRERFLDWLEAMCDA